MFQYEFVKIETDKNAWSGKVTFLQDHHQVIDEYAHKGWRLVQIFAPSFGYTYWGGGAWYVELIFEKQVAE